jgi:pre-rRNA-processing protein TSR3
MSKTIIIRLNKESPKKCSLTPLRQRDDLDIEWYHCNLGDEIEVGAVTLLHPDGVPLSSADAERPLLLIDSSWRDLPRMLSTVHGDFALRCLPKNLVTAYPRKSKTFEDPETGLASVEALHAATVWLGRRDDSLLEGYYFGDKWLALNPQLNDEN